MHSAFYVCLPALELRIRQTEIQFSRETKKKKNICFFLILKQKIPFTISHIHILRGREEDGERKTKLSFSLTSQVLTAFIGRFFHIEKSIFERSKFTFIFALCDVRIFSSSFLQAEGGTSILTYENFHLFKFSFLKFYFLLKYQRFVLR